MPAPAPAWRPARPDKAMWVDRPADRGGVDQTRHHQNQHRDHRPVGKQRQCQQNVRLPRANSADRTASPPIQKPADSRCTPPDHADGGKPAGLAAAAWLVALGSTSARAARSATASSCAGQKQDPERQGANQKELAEQSGCGGLQDGALAHFARHLGCGQREPGATRRQRQQHRSPARMAHRCDADGQRNSQVKARCRTAACCAK